jgi:hypothetical protein
LVIGHWSLVIGHWSLVIGHWSLVVGRWSLVIGRWSFGHWPLVVFARRGRPSAPVVTSRRRRRGQRDVTKSDSHDQRPTTDDQRLTGSENKKADAAETVSAV